MTRINDYIWHLPHTPEEGDPPDIAVLQELFNAPILSLIQEPIDRLGYELKSNDIIVRLDGRLDRTADTYYANVRFIHYLRPDVIVRVHFEHAEWAHFLATSDEHRYFINLDRFKLIDPATQIPVPSWAGRLHTRVSNSPDYILEHSGEDQIWAYTSPQQLEDQLNLFWEKFISVGRDWLENPSTLS